MAYRDIARTAVDRPALSVLSLTKIVEFSDPDRASPIPPSPVLIRQTLLYLPAQIIGPMAQFAAIIVFTHWMMPGPYGIFTYALAGQDFVFLLSLSWWSQYTVRFFGDHGGTADGNYRRSELSIVVATILVQIVAALLALRLVVPEISVPLALATALYTVTRCLTVHIGERARAGHRILDYTLAQSLGPLAGLAAAFLLVAFVDASPEAALFGYGLAQAPILIWLTLRQDIAFAFRRPDGALLRRSLGFGLPLIAAGLAAWCGMNAIRILVDRDMGAAMMGLIAVGWGLGNRLTSTAAMLVTVAAYPLAVDTLRSGAREEALRHLMANGLLMLGILLPAAVGLFCLQGPVVALLVAAPFREMTLAVLPASLAAGLFRNVRTHVADQIFMLVERTGTVFVLSIVEALLAIVGCVIGLEWGGAPGATVGTAAGYGVALIVGFGAVRVMAGVRMPWRDALLIGIAVAVMAVVLDMMPAPAAPLLAIVVKVGLGAMVYLGLVLALFPTLFRFVTSRVRERNRRRAWPSRR